MVPTLTEQEREAKKAERKFSYAREQERPPLTIGPCEKCWKVAIHEECRALNAAEYQRRRDRERAESSHAR